METDCIVVVGASAGGLDAMVTLLSRLPADYPYPIMIASHSTPASQLYEALHGRRDVQLPIIRASDGQTLVPGQVHVVPGARHALVRGDKITVSGPVEDSGFRPSIDALFMTAAASYGRGTIAVVLSGTLNDGMRGAQVVYDMGGKTVVQDPEEAKFESMPEHVIRSDHPHQILRAADLGDWLATHVPDL